MNLREYLNKNGLKAKWFSKQIGYSNCHISNVITGRYKASKRFVKAVELFTKGMVGPDDFKEKDWTNE